MPLRCRGLETRSGNVYWGVLAEVQLLYLEPCFNISFVRMARQICFYVQLLRNDDWADPIVFHKPGVFSMHPNEAHFRSEMPFHQSFRRFRRLI